MSKRRRRSKRSARHLARHQRSYGFVGVDVLEQEARGAVAQRAEDALVELEGRHHQHVDRSAHRRHRGRALGVAVSLWMWTAFPFDLTGYGTDWTLALRIAFVVGVVATSSAVLVGLAQAHRRRSHVRRFPVTRGRHRRQRRTVARRSEGGPWSSMSTQSG